METKNVTFRLPLDVIDWIEVGGKSKNEVVVNSLRVLKKIRQVSTRELRGVFTPEEWRFLAESLNGVTPDAFRCSTSALIAHVEDADALDNLDTKWGVVVDELVTKISNLHGANVDALYTRVEDFWARPDADFGKLAEF